MCFCFIPAEFGLQLQLVFMLFDYYFLWLFGFSVFTLLGITINTCVSVSVSVLGCVRVFVDVCVFSLNALSGFNLIKCNYCLLWFLLF